MIAEKVLGNLRDAEQGTRRIDRVRLTHDEIAKPHQKVTTESGRIIGISLPEGEHLHNGDILYQDGSVIIVIDLKEEEVFEIRPKNNMEWAKAAFNVGNMHQRAYLYHDCIRAPYDSVLEKMMEILGVDYSREIRKLDGIPANLSASGSRHAHSHHHHDDHNL
ncbi:MAG: urease accessory protein UreE [Eubacteriales bacterium]|nr:urease accessory protein UreE [Eubacteriales bacterium]